MPLAHPGATAMRANADRRVTQAPCRVGGYLWSENRPASL